LLQISLVAVPVKAYPAVSTTNASYFNQLHADCGQRIHYHKHCPQHGLVDSAAIVRGYQYAPEQYVVVEPEELDQLRPARDRALALEQFVTPQQIDPALFAGRSLYLLPDGQVAQHPYAVVAQALGQAGKAGLGRVVLGSQRQLALVRPAGRLLVLDVLHYPAQVRAAAGWEAALSGGTATAEELQLARRLIDTAGGPLDWSRYRDTTAAELAALVESKVANRPPPAADQEPLGLRPLLEALQQSVAAVRKSPAAGAPGKVRKGRRASA